MKTIDWYIIRKFLGTFFFVLLLLIFVIIVFDISEKLDDFLRNDAPLSAILFDYYLSFVPYFINLFSYLLVFIAVIFFTSRMAAQSEIVAILSNGISFRRLMFPYFVSAVVLGLISFLLANFIIPYTNRSMLAFERRYINDKKKFTEQNIHKQVSPGTFIYLEYFNTGSDKQQEIPGLRAQTGTRFSLEKLSGRNLVYKLQADNIAWDSANARWKLSGYTVRELSGLNESLRRGSVLDTVLPFRPEDLAEDIEEVKIMNFFALEEHIRKKELRGDPDLIKFKVKKYERIAFPFATLILTLIGVAVSSRKVRGGIGFHLGFGLALTFVYILFMQIFTVFATFGDLNPILAVWIPNLFFGLVAAVMYRLAPK